MLQVIALDCKVIYDVTSGADYCAQKTSSVVQLRNFYLLRTYAL